MPTARKSQSIDRLLALLGCIPSAGLATPQDLRAALAQQGLTVDTRTVQRDLRLLQQHFAIECDERSKPHGWRWRSSAAQGRVLGLSTPEALGLALLERHLRHAMPASWSASLTQLFTQARAALDKLGPHSGANRWARKIQVVPPGLGSLPAALPSGEVLAQVSDALLQERQLRLSYRKPGAPGERSYRVHPLGLLLRGSNVYLVAVNDADRTGPLRHFALHRVVAAEALPQPVALPAALDMDAAMAAGAGQFGVAAADESIDLCFRCDAELARLLEEAPLSPTQVLRPLPRDQFEVRLQIALSWELRWWLLAHVAQLEVLAPASLREELRNTLQAAALRHAGGDGLSPQPGAGP